MVDPLNGMLDTHQNETTGGKNTHDKSFNDRIRVENGIY